MSNVKSHGNVEDESQTTLFLSRKDVFDSEAKVKLETNEIIASYSRKHSFFGQTKTNAIWNDESFFFKYDGGFQNGVNVLDESNEKIGKFEGTSSEYEGTIHDYRSGEKYLYSRTGSWKEYFFEIRKRKDLTARCNIVKQSGSSSSGNMVVFGN